MGEVRGGGGVGRVWRRVGRRPVLGVGRGGGVKGGVGGAV